MLFQIFFFQLDVIPNTPQLIQRFGLFKLSFLMTFNEHPQETISLIVTETSEQKVTNCLKDNTRRTHFFHLHLKELPSSSRAKQRRKLYNKKQLKIGDIYFNFFILILLFSGN